MPVLRSRLVLAASAFLTLVGAATAVTEPAHGQSVLPAAAPADWPSYHGRANRAGLSRDMPAASGALHRTASIPLDGAVYASPIVAGGGTTLVVTENNTVYAFDRSFRQLWKHHLGAPSPAGERPCGNIDPLGITGTPVYDATHGTVLVAPEYGGPPRHEVAALKLATGAYAWHRNIDLAGVETKAMQERGALAIAGGRVWIPFGGLAGDCGGYKGRVVGVSLSGTGKPIAYTVPTTREAGIWTPPGPTVDSDGRLFVAVGNGESGAGDPYDHSDSVLKISSAAKLLDSFSPTTWPTDNDLDLDLGSQGPAFVSGGRWVFSAGKRGTAYVLHKDHLGGIGGEVSQAKVCPSFGGTAVSNDIVYVPCADGVRAVRIDSAGTMHVLWHAAQSIAGSPVVGGGRVWSLESDNGVLHALSPQTGRTLQTLVIGATSRFATPALYGKYVLVGTLTGLVVVSTS